MRKIRLLSRMSHKPCLPSTSPAVSLRSSATLSQADSVFTAKPRKVSKIWYGFYKEEDTEGLKPLLRGFRPHKGSADRCYLSLIPWTVLQSAWLSDDETKSLLTEPTTATQPLAKSRKVPKEFPLDFTSKPEPESKSSPAADSSSVTAETKESDDITSVKQSPVIPWKFDAMKYRRHLHTATLGQSLIFADKMESTQSWLKWAVVESMRSKPKVEEVAAAKRLALDRAVVSETEGVETDTGKHKEHAIASAKVKLPIGSTLVCNEQLKGRGRGANVWQSPAGCMMCSFSSAIPATMRPEIVRKCLPSFQHLMALCIVNSTVKMLTKLVVDCYIGDAVVDTDAGSELRRETQKSVESKLSECIRIKWPNDLYYYRTETEMHKLGGILCESVYDSSLRAYVICTGFALDLCNDEPTVSLIRVLREQLPELSSGCLPDLTQCREQLLATILTDFENEYFDKFIREGFEPFIEEYTRHWLHSDQKVWVKPCADSDEMKRVTITGLKDDGMLLATDKDFNVYSLCSDSNSFDLMKGLIYRKL